MAARSRRPTHHVAAPVAPGAAFGRLARAHDVERLHLTPAQCAAYERDGFVGPVPVLDAAQVTELRRRVDDIRARLPELAPRLYEVEQGYQDAPDRVVCHFLGGWRVDPWLHDLVFAPAVTVPLAQLLGVRQLRFWHDQVFYKPPRHPGVVPWHQDYSYWTRATPARHITLNVMLDDADEDNGCVHFVPGSHRWGLLPKAPFDGDMDAVRGVLTDDQRRAFRPRPMPLRAGCASIHHSHTLHGSSANRSDRPRRAVVLNYMAADTLCGDGTRPLLRGVPRIAAGARIDGEFFPIALDLDRLA